MSEFEMSPSEADMAHEAQQEQERKDRIEQFGFDVTDTSLWKGYTCHKSVLAVPMSRGIYNKYQGWQIPENENPDDEGYLVQYLDGGEPNHPDHDYYISWSPKDVFEKGYSETKVSTPKERVEVLSAPNGQLDFSDALRALKFGYRVQRSGWNGKDMWLSVSNLNTATVPADKFWSPHNSQYAAENGGSAEVPPCITMKNAKGQIQMGWAPSPEDMFCSDWFVFEKE